MSEQEYEAALAGDVEITDLDARQWRRRTVMQSGDGRGRLPRRRLYMGLGTLLGIGLLALLVVSPWHLVGAAQPGKTSSQSRAVHQASPNAEQVVFVGRFIYSLDKDGVVSARWIRHKYVYLLWQQRVALSFRLLRVDQDVVYLGAADGSMVALRARDGAVLWSIGMRDQKRFAGWIGSRSFVVR